MKAMPRDMQPYKRTAVFTQDGIPAGLLHRHHTKAGVWARIVLLTGRLRYRILAEPPEEHILTPERPGVIEDGVPHEVAPLGEVEFYVEFYRRPEQAEEVRT